MGFSTTGALFPAVLTLQTNVSFAVPPFPSSAVMVIFAEPSPTSVKVSVVPEILAVTTFSSSDVEVSVSTSLSASENTLAISIVTEPKPSVWFTSATGFSTIGALFTDPKSITEISSTYKNHIFTSL